MKATPAMKRTTFKPSGKTGLLVTLEIKESFSF